MQDELRSQTPQNEFLASKSDETAEVIVTGTTHINGEGPIPLTEAEVEKIRLLLSIYQDGSGMIALPNGLSLPGWRDFERAVASTLRGKPPMGLGKEGKNVFDVVVSIATNQVIGISCKMKKPGENRLLTRNNRVYIEMANSAKKFWQVLKVKGIDETNYKSKATEAGIALVELIATWHREGATLKGGATVDLDKSFYLTLSWNSKGDYQLHQFPLYFADPRTLS